MLARVLLAQERPGQALALLDRLHVAAVTHDRAGSLIEVGALRALALVVSGEERGSADGRSWPVRSCWLARKVMCGSSPTRARGWPRWSVG